MRSVCGDRALQMVDTPCAVGYDHATRPDGGRSDLMEVVGEQATQRRDLELEGAVREDRRMRVTGHDFEAPRKL